MLVASTTRLLIVAAAGWICVQLLRAPPIAFYFVVAASLAAYGLTLAVAIRLRGDDEQRIGPIEHFDGQRVVDTGQQLDRLRGVDVRADARTTRRERRRRLEPQNRSAQSLHIEQRQLHATVFAQVVEIGNGLE